MDVYTTKISISKKKIGPYFANKSVRILGLYCKTKAFSAATAAAQMFTPILPQSGERFCFRI